MNNKLLLKVARFIRKYHKENVADQEMSDDALYEKAYQFLNYENMSCDEKEAFMDKAYEIAVNPSQEKYYK